MRKGLVVLSFLLVGAILPGAVQDLSAQEREWTCDGGPFDILNAAQTAMTDEDTETAWSLAAHAEVLCVNDSERFAEANALRTTIQTKSWYHPERDATVEYDLGDYELDMVCMGEGSPAVILESGFDTGHGQWRDVLPALSTVTRTCAYSRYGIYPSDSNPNYVGRTTQDHVDDLVRLLALAEIEPPYILVGACIGGQDVIVYTEQNPENVKGIVLVEPDHPEMWNRWIEAGTWPVSVGRNQLFASSGFGAERYLFEISAEQAAAVENIGDRPLAVIVATEGWTGGDSIWMELMEDYAGYSTNSCIIIAEGTEHNNIHSVSPETVIEAALWVLDEVAAVDEAID